MKKISILLIIAALSISFTGCSADNADKNSASADSAAENYTSNNLSNFGLSDDTNYYGNTFAQKEVSDVYIEINDDDWQAILDNPTAEEYHSATITYNGQKIENVGFRTKGFSSLTSVAQSDSDRYGFRVKMDKYVDGQTLNGLDDLVLNASFADPSYMREYLTYSAMAYLDGITPFANYTKLYINGELYGLYLCIEAYDDSFVERNSSGKDVNLYKADSENCTLSTSDDASGFDLKYGDDEDNKHIKELITVLNNTTSENKDELAAILDINSVLKAAAVNTVMGNYDSYSGSKAHNYYLLYEDGKFSYIGWDYNMSLGGFTEDSGASVTVDITLPVYNVDISNRPLLGKLLAIDEYYETYLGYVNSLCKYFSNAESMIEEIKSYISEDVENDPTAFYTYDQFETAISLSDTDLSQVTSGMISGPQGGGNMEIGEGMTPPNGSEMMQPGEAPADGVTPPNIEMPNGTDNNNGTQTPPADMQLPDGADMQMPGGDNMQSPQGGGGGIISSTSCSIRDYLNQRIENIKSQLSES